MFCRDLAKAFLALLVASPLACSSGASDETQDDDAIDEGALTSSELAARGEKQVHFPVSGRPDELCIVSKKSAGGVYSEADRVAEASLCTLGFGNAGPMSVALCPNIASGSNPRIEVLALAGKAKREVEQSNCARSLAPENVATFEQSVACSYTGSILGYYHASRFLGGAGNVPAAVIRTMDVEAHAALVERAATATTSVDRAGFDVHDAWLQFRSMDAAPREFGRFAQVYTADAQQLYGALRGSINGDLPHPFLRTTRGDNGLQQFMKSTAFEVVSSVQPLAERFATTLSDKSAVQGVVLAKDTSDMVLLDELMSQADRYGNVHSVAFKIFDEGGRLKKVALARDARTGAPIDRSDVEGVMVEELVLRDNQCGVTKENRNAKFGLVAKLAHMSARTYEHFQWFAKQIAVSGSPVEKFLRDEALLTPMDIQWMSRRATSLATTLKTRCDSGALALDADLQPHLSGATRARSTTACAAAAPPRASTNARTIDSHGIELVTR